MYSIFFLKVLAFQAEDGFRVQEHVKVFKVENEYSYWPELRKVGLSRARG